MELLAYGTTQTRGCNFLASHIHISSIWYFMGDIGRLGVCQRVDVRVGTSTTGFNHSVR